MSSNIGAKNIIEYILEKEVESINEKSVKVCLSLLNTPDDIESSTYKGLLQMKDSLLRLKQIKEWGKEFGINNIKLDIDLSNASFSPYRLNTMYVNTFKENNNINIIITFKPMSKCCYLYNNTKDGFYILNKVFSKHNININT